MPADNLPETLREQQSQAHLSAEPPSTTPPESGPAVEATTGLDLRDYELIEHLGGGGMGDVYRAGDPALGRDLAVKVMKAGLQGYDIAERRFVREARVTGSLQHPGIVPIYNLGRLSDGRLHYTMRLVRGRTLAEILREEAGRPEYLSALMTIFEKLCQAVAYAHSKQVIHRDLKPANVMVGRFGEVQVMDWGLAKVLTPGQLGYVSASKEEKDTRVSTEEGETPPELTRLGREMGTPAYMPAEQALGEWEAVDERADVFALGAMLCEILTGSPPYSGGDRDKVLHKAKRGELSESLARLDGCGADVSLVGLCRDCLASARECRPRDAEQVAQRVAAYQSEVQERLRRAELERAAAEVRAREEGKRRRLAFAFVFLLSAAVVLIGWLAIRATDSAKAERQANDLAQTRLGQIEKANDVLASIFRDLDPRAEDRGGPSLRLQMGQHMEKAAAQLDDLAIGDPITAARLRYTLGRALNGLGRAREGIQLLGQAYQTQESQLGPNHLDTLNSMLELALAHHADGQLDKSAALLEACLQRRQANLGPTHPDTLFTMCALAGIYLAMHQFEKVEPFLGALEAQEAVAELDDLAMAYELTGQVDKALRLSELVVKLRKVKNGPDDLQTLSSMTGLAAVYRRIGEEEKAIRIYEEVLPKQRAKLPADDKDTLTTMQSLGVAYCATGQMEKGLALLEQSWERWKAKHGAGSPTAQPRRLALARMYQRAGRFGPADTLLREGLALQRAKDDLASATTLRLEATLGFNLLHQHKYAEAEQLLRHCVKGYAAKQPNDWETFSAQSTLGEALLGQKRYHEAEPLLVKSYEGLNQHKSKRISEVKIRLREALERLVRLYEATDQAGKAVEWRKKMEETKETKP